MALYIINNIILYREGYTWGFFIVNAIKYNRFIRFVIRIFVFCFICDLILIVLFMLHTLCLYLWNPLQTLDTIMYFLERCRGAVYTLTCSLLAHHTTMTCGEGDSVALLYWKKRNAHFTNENTFSTNKMKGFHDTCN